MVVKKQMKMLFLHLSFILSHAKISIWGEEIIYWSECYFCTYLFSWYATGNSSHKYFELKEFLVVVFKYYWSECRKLRPDCFDWTCRKWRARIAVFFAFIFVVSIKVFNFLGFTILLQIEKLIYGLCISLVFDSIL